MAEQPEAVDLDRESLMLVWHAEGKPRCRMIEPLIKLGLLACHEGHKKRSDGRDGEVCVTCENTLNVSWKRYLYRTGFETASIEEVRGALIAAYETVERICLERYIQNVETVTETSGDPDKEGNVSTALTTRRETKIHVGLLRLYVEVNEKRARLGGVRVDKVAARDRIPRSIFRVNERAKPHGDDERTN